ncbi:MAG: ATP-binding cassette domain-containing protein [Desulfobulbaceae bacterium]|nr:ATP-binding cassette domain-containing protein [Desulfobulbaceae bacterium]
MPPVIQLENISKSYAERTWKSVLFRKTRRVQALHDISLSVQEGEVMGLLGPNGAGKTTLIKILATLVSPDSGSGSVSGLDLLKQAHLIRHQIGLVSTNDRTFYWRLSGWDNLSFFASLYNLHGAYKEQRINEVLDLVDILDKADFRFMSYSAGQRQRLAIARALLSNPDVLFLDEATSSLDPIAARKLIQFTKINLAEEQKKTIIWCTHNLNEADEICDRLVILSHGRLIQDGTTSAIKQILGQGATYRFTVSAFSSELENYPGFRKIENRGNGTMSCIVQLDSSKVPELINTLTAAGIRVYECAKIKRPLEEVFTELIERENGTG